MGTGSPGGDYTIYGPAWGQLIQKQTQVGIAYLSSGGAEANILLIDQNNAQLGLTSLVVANEARMGSGDWTAGARFHSFRALFPAFSSILQIISPYETGIATLRGLAGRRIGIGPPGSSSAVVVPTVLKSVGIKPTNIFTGSYVSQLNEMIAGRLDACAIIGAPPVPAIAAIALRQKLSLIGFSSAEISQIRNALPGMAPMTIAAHMFPAQTVAVASVGTQNIAIGVASLPYALAYTITKVALSNQSLFASLVSGAAIQSSVNAVTDAGISFHPGAAAALIDFGVTIPKQSIEP